MIGTVVCLLLTVWRTRFGCSSSETGTVRVWVFQTPSTTEPYFWLVYWLASCCVSNLVEQGAKEMYRQLPGCLLPKLRYIILKNKQMQTWSPWTLATSFQLIT